MRIVFCGSGSTGKSTLLKKLQQDDRFKNYEFFDEITETAHKMGFNINTSGTDATQKAIMNIHRTVAERINIIASRCAIDCICYSIYLYNHDQVSQKVFDELYADYLDLVKKYDIIFYIRPEFKPEANGIRSTNQNFIDEVANNFEEVIIRDNLKVKILRGSVDERMKQIYEVLDEAN